MPDGIIRCRVFRKPRPTAEVLETLRNPNEPIEARLAALDALEGDRRLSADQAYSVKAYMLQLREALLLRGPVTTGGITFTADEEEPRILRRLG